jgi:hypothetical protein
MSKQILRKTSYNGLRSKRVIRRKRLIIIDNRASLNASDITGTLEIEIR